SKPAGIDKCVTQLVNTVQHAMKETTPLKRPRPHAKRWWTRRLTVLRREANKLRNKYRRTGQEQHRRTWRNKANEYTKEIAQAKATTWQGFVENINAESIWQAKKFLSGVSPQTVIPTLDGIAETYEQMADTLQRSFFPSPPPADLSDLRHA